VKIDGCVAIVTGGASGLGRATALHLARRGATVVAVDIAKPSPGQQTHDRIVDLTADVTDVDEVAAAVEEAAARGPLRVVVNCAGIATPGRVHKNGRPLDLDTFRRVIEVNLVGTFNMLSQATARIVESSLIDGERGVIVNTSSVAAFDGQVGQAAYAAAKAAIAGMTLPLARELAEHEIRVVSVAPGMFETPLLAGLPRQAIDSLGRQVPHPARLGRPEEFAELVGHIVTNPMINGEVIRIDGAIRMAPR
jgi:NAD(P)-dependent dehydrogenase (short-subunit alcohol dehydrogenase family)